MITIAVDAFGGDHSPSEIVMGAIDALTNDNDLAIVLVGDEEKTKQELDACLALLPQAESARSVVDSRLTVSHASQVIGCDESPISAIRRKKDSSIVRMATLVRDGVAHGCVSAGSTGAVLASGVFIIGRIPGIERPALCPLLPNVRGGHTLLVDCGANVDCKSSQLMQFARMGVAYEACLTGNTKPRVALLSNGAEDEKGSELIKETNSLLRASQLHFVGNIEGRDILSGDADIVVCDGLHGNIALKSCEGTAGAVFALLKKEISRSFRAKLGALLLKPVLKRILKRMDYTEYGGAAFLGVNAPMVKVHGSTKAKSVREAILQCKEMVSAGLIASLTRCLDD